jgi:glycosyltransferase involved in cell wall biosynthesis
VRVIECARNQGKGAAVETGARAAASAGFTHVLTMDADGQHPATDIPRFMSLSTAQPAALVCGVPVFDATVPRERLHGRKISVALVRLELFGGRVRDSLFGFRVYPLAPLLAAFASTRWGRRYDFDTELAVRMVWAGTPTVNTPAPVRYFRPEEGGVSHFRYLRDNVRLAWMHARLLLELLLWRWPAAWRGRRQHTLA